MLPLFKTKQKKFETPGGGHSGHPRNFHLWNERLLNFYKPSWAIIIETKMTIYIISRGVFSNYENTHDYVEYSDFYYDFQNLGFFGIFPLNFIVSVSMISKEILSVARFYYKTKEI